MKIAIACMLLFSICPACGAEPDWIALHEIAAKTGFEQALERSQQDPGSLEANYVFGLVCLGLHKDGQAADAFRKVSRIDPAFPGGKWGEAEVMRRRHQVEKSEPALREIIRGHPGFVPAYLSLAYVEYIKTNFEASSGIAYQVLKMGRQSCDLSNFARAYLLYAGAKGMIAHYGGPFSKAINGTAVFPNLKNAEELQPGSPQVYFGLGAFYLLAPPVIGGNLKKAGEYLDKAIAGDPFLADAYVRRAQAYLMEGKTAEYQSYLAKALEIDPGNELALDVKNRRCRFICPER